MLLVRAHNVLSRLVRGRVALQRIALNVLGAATTLAPACLAPSCGQTLSTRSCTWDESYERAVQLAPSYAPNEATEPVRAGIATTAARWPRQRVEAARAVSQLGPITAQVRLEASFSFAAITDLVVWVVQTTGSQRFVVISDQNGLRTRQVTEAEWLAIETTIPATTLRGGLYYQQVDDSVYFTSWDLSGRCGQFVVYQPIFASRFPDVARVYQDAISTEKEIIQSLVQLARGEAR